MSELRTDHLSLKLKEGTRPLLIKAVGTLTLRRGKRVTLTDILEEALKDFFTKEHIDELAESS